MRNEKYTCSLLEILIPRKDLVYVLTYLKPLVKLLYTLLQTGKFCAG